MYSDTYSQFKSYYDAISQVGLWLAGLTVVAVIILLILRAGRQKDADYLSRSKRWLKALAFTLFVSLTAGLFSAGTSVGPSVNLNTDVQVQQQYNRDYVILVISWLFIAFGAILIAHIFVKPSATAIERRRRRVLILLVAGLFTLCFFGWLMGSRMFIG